MKTLLFLGVLIQLNMTTFCQTEKLRLNYSLIGLGSNRFHSFPRLTIKGQTLIYEENFEKRIRYRTQMRLGAWDSIKQIINSIKDTAVERINPCILSGGIYRLNVVSRSKTVHFTLTNTFDSAAYKIITIINGYLPQKYRLGIPFSRWENEQPCMDELRSKADSMQNQKSGVQH